MSTSTDPATLKRQYADEGNLAARASIYAFQHPRVDFAKWVLDHLPEEALAGTLLDVGCGPGWSVAHASQRGALAIGCDLSAGMVHKAAADVPSALGWLVGDASRLPIADRSCAAASALHMLYHVPDPARAVEELRRVVRPGGTVLVVLNGDDHMDTYRSLMAEAAGRTEWLPWSSSRVNLSTVDLFDKPFASVELDELRARIVLNDVQPLVSYAGSAREFYERQVDCSWGDLLARFTQAADRHLARHGTIEITTHSGVFVCTTAA